MSRPHLLFVTGKLAEPSLRRTLADMASAAGFDFSVAVLPISVASLATTTWIATHLTVPPGVDRVVLPGLCLGELEPLATALRVPVERGPKDLRDLPELFGQACGRPADYGSFDIEIIAEINHASRLSLEEFLAAATQLRRAGADVIDVGCDPGGPWLGVGDAVQALRDQGMRVSIDSFEAAEVTAAVKAGAELVLSVNSGNVSAAADWGCEVVAVPDVAGTLEGLETTLDCLRKQEIAHRIDAILEPIGFGFPASLGRYLEIRRRYPEAALMMGVGNLTELTDVDSAGINVLLLGFCQEAGIRSVLTTQVINWCRSCVRELDLARRLVYHAVRHRVPPKRLETALVMLRDPKVHEHGDKALQELAATIKDNNFRLFAERGMLHAINGRAYLQDADPFALFAAMRQHGVIDSAHAFYLGYEMAKALTSLTLGKDYVQDQALNWGMLTRPEQSHRQPPAQE